MAESPGGGARSLVPRALVAAPWTTAAVVAGAQYVRGLGQRTVVSDWAVLVVRAREVGTSATPVTGAWSRYGWAHPGPALQWLMSVPVRLFGPVPGAMLTAFAVNLVAAAVLWAFTRRFGPLVHATGGLGVLGLVALRPFAAVDFWNASVVMLPLAAFLLATALAIEGPSDRPTLGTSLLAGTWCAQVHVGTAPLVAAGWLVLLAVLIRRRALRDSLVAVRAPALVAGASWLVPLLAPRNLARIVRYLVNPPPESAQGVLAGVQVALEVAGGSLPWATGSLRAPLFVVEPRWLPWSGLLLVVLAVIAWRHRFPSARLLLALWAVQALALGAIRGPLLFWLVWPAFSLAMVSAVAIARAGPPTATRWLLPLVPAATAALVVGWLQEPDDDPPWQQTHVASLVDWGVPRIDLGPSELIVIADANFLGNDGKPLGGLVERLDRRGVVVRTDPALALQWGGRRSWTCGEAMPAWWLVEPALLDRSAELTAQGWQRRDTWPGPGPVTDLWHHPAWDPCTG